VYLQWTSAVYVQWTSAVDRACLRQAGEPSPKRQTPGATLASDDEKGISAAPTHKACRTEREVATAACYGWETDDRATV